VKCQTEPELSNQVSKPSPVVNPVASEVFATILTTLKHLQHTSQTNV